MVFVLSQIFKELTVLLSPPHRDNNLDLGLQILFSHFFMVILKG